MNRNIPTRELARMQKAFRLSGNGAEKILLGPWVEMNRLQLGIPAPKPFLKIVFPDVDEQFPQVLACNHSGSRP